METYAQNVLSKMIAEENVERLPEVAERVCEMIRTAPLEGSTAAMRGRAERNDFTETLRAWEKPALVIVGDSDAFDNGAGQAMSELLRHGELEVVPASGPTPNMENPAEYDAALGAFLSRLV